MNQTRAILAIAIPMVFANLSVPLLGFVDTAILGHLDAATSLAAVHLGSSILSLAFWSFGFLRMSTTGITSRELGAGNSAEVRFALIRSLLVAWGMALPVIALGWFIFPLLTPALAHGSQVSEPALTYLQIRIWSAPATLSAYAVIGWLIGLGNSRAAMWIMIFTNLGNAALDYLFIVKMGMGLRGAALASVLAEYSALIPAIWIVVKELANFSAKSADGLWQKDRFLALLRANRDIFIRTLCLLLVFLSMSSLAVGIDPETAAATAILLNLLAFAAYFMDGFAFAAESLGGQAWGRRNLGELIEVFKQSSVLALGIALLFSLAFLCFEQGLLGLYTDLEGVLDRASHLMAWLIWLPIVAVWCYQLDGLFIGIGHTRTLRNAMLFSALSYAAILAFAARPIAASTLWNAFWAFHLVRGVSLGIPLLLILRESHR